MRKSKWMLQLFFKRFAISILIILELAFMLYTVISNSYEFEILQKSLRCISIFVALHVMISKRKGAYKSSLIFLILLFPVFGGFFYLFFKWQTGLRRLHKSISHVQEKSKKLFLLGSTGYENAVAAAPEHENQIRYLYSCADFPVYENTKTEYFPLGEDMLEALKREIALAEKYIFLEYFIIHDGDVWRELWEILEQKAEDGVDVRVIYDDLGCFLGLPSHLEEHSKSRIKRIPFNKFVPFLSGVQNNRDHRKIAVIDGKTAFTGGVNIADEYANRIEKYGHWKDTAVMLKGPAAWSFSLMFLQMWQVCTRKKEGFSDFYPDEMPVYADSGFSLPYSDTPADEENVSEHVYLQLINSARKYVYITTPYLIIDDSMVSALTLAAKSGIDVRIITPCKYDKRWVHVTTKSYYRTLINAGVRIYEYTPGFIHAKSFVSDDTTATVGTANLDFRSLYFHFECGVWMYKTEAVKSLHDDFLSTLDECREIKHEDCQRSLFLRFFEAVLRVFAPLM